MVLSGTPDGRYPERINKTHYLIKKNCLRLLPQIIGWGDTGPFPLFHTSWLMNIRDLLHTIIQKGVQNENGRKFGIKNQ